MEFSIKIIYISDKYNASQLVEEWPFGMNADYFKIVTPQGYFRSWFFSENNRAGETFDYGISLKFLNSGTEVSGQTIGGMNTYDEADSYDESYNEIYYPIHDLYSFDFDSLM